MKTSLLASTFLFSPVFACNPSGTYVDRSGNIASLLVSPDGTINATSYSGTRWSSCVGKVIDETHLWLAFHPTDNETATFVSNCSALEFPGAEPSVWGKVGNYNYPDAKVTDVHLVWMSHLDLGYTSYARTVCDEYFSLLLPANIALSKQLAATDTPYVHTSHSFLIAEFLDGAAGCAHSRPSPSSIADMEEAIQLGYIRWHAQSANYNTPLLDKKAFIAQIKESNALNAQFNVTYGTELMKSTDVPGFSRSMIPHLNSLGRRAVHTGANGKCTLPRIPQAFTWAHPETGTSVLALATNDYGGTLIIPPHALIILYQGDNGGPPSASSVASNYASAKEQFPGARVYNSSFELFVESALSSTPGANAEGFPVITSEIGDSWLYGAPATPDKLAIFRESRRVITDALAGILPGQTDPLLEDDPNLLAFQRRIMVGGPEHNGGCSIGGYLPSCRGIHGDWNKTAFHKNLATRIDYEFVQGSYDEKLNLTSQPLDPIAPVSSAWMSFLAARESRIDALTPTVPDVSSWTPLTNISSMLTCGRLSVSLNATDGSIASLVDSKSGHEWIGGSHFAGFVYRTYIENDFSIFNAEYNPGCGVPCENFSKDGMDSASPESREWYPTVLGAYTKNNAPSVCSILIHLEMPIETIVKYGAAQDVWVSLEVDADPTSSSPELEMSLMMFNKTGTRLAEASWVSFNPNLMVTGRKEERLNNATSNNKWWIEVIGEPIDPLDVVPFGTRHLHAADSSFGFGGVMSSRIEKKKGSNRTVNDKEVNSVTSFIVTTLDASLVAPGDRDHLLFYDGNNLPDMSGGMHVNLHNNLWGTTFAQWFSSPALLFRFVITLEV